MTTRADRHNNPTAFTSDLAKQAGLIEGQDYEQGDPFTVGTRTFTTARLLHDPLALTLKLIEAVGFYNKANQQRWVYIGLPSFVWAALNPFLKVRVVAFMYQHEGGTLLKSLFT